MKPSVALSAQREAIGEASRNITVHYPAFADAHPELPLKAAYQMRNAVADGYFKVDSEIVWRTIEQDLPRLLVRTRSAITSLSHDRG